MKRPVAYLAALALSVAGLTLATTTSAQAHTGEATATCDGVHVVLTRYDTRGDNSLRVVIAGNVVVDLADFGASYDETLPVPQAGKTSAWSVDVDAWDGERFDLHVSGSVGPCGEKPPPPLKHTRTVVKVVDRCKCRRDIVRVVSHPHAAVKVTRPSKNVWKVRVAARKGYVVPSRYGHRAPWVKRAVYTFRTTDKPCPCERTHSCHKVHHPKPCACKP